MAFTEVQFPADISYGSSGGPEFATDIVMLSSGHEQRNANWSQSRIRYNVAHGVKTKAQLDGLIAFFRARRGRAEGFRFKDWSDFQAQAQVIAVADGVQTAFQLVKTYSSGGVQVARTIHKPVAPTVRVYVGGAEQTEDVVLDATSGILTFAEPPADSAVISADFEFDVPVRFDTDRLSVRLEDYGVYSALDIALVELRM